MTPRTKKKRTRRVTLRSTTKPKPEPREKPGHNGKVTLVAKRDDQTVHVDKRASGKRGEIDKTPEICETACVWLISHFLPAFG